MRSKKEWNERLAKAPTLALPSGGWKSIYGRGIVRIKKYIDWDYIQPKSKIVDLGCGIGADAIGLEQWTEWNGNYLGIDAKKYCVDFNRKQHGGDERFHFDHSDISNSRYNPSGKKKTLGYRLPVDDVDFVMCHSFFSHTGPMKYVRHYLREIWRVLKHDGLAMTTWHFGVGDELTFEMKRTVYHRLEIETILSDGFDVIKIIEANEGKQTKIVIRRKR